MRSAIGFGLSVHLGVTVDDIPPFEYQNLSVYRVPWSENFADARNNLLGQIRSSGAYVLWLDSDEILLSYPSGLGEHLLDPIHGVQVVVREGQTTSVRSFCHRRSDAVRFSGSIHERLRLASAQGIGPVSVLPGVVILHTGYEDPERTQSKTLRNFRIAEAAVAAGEEDWGTFIATARYFTSTGQASALDWIRVHRAAEQSAEAFPTAADRRWEAAAALAHCGFLRPAERLSAAEPLNIPLQMALLVGSHAVSGACYPERLMFVARCLQNCLWDQRYTFPLSWLTLSIEALSAHVREEADGLPWTGASDYENQGDEGMDRQTEFVRADDIMSETFEGELVLLSRQTNRVLTLNETAQIFWDALEFGISMAEGCAFMREALTNQTDSQIEAEIEALFATFLEHGFIREKSLEG